MLDGDSSENNKDKISIGINYKKESNLIFNVKKSIKQAIFTLISKSFPMSEDISDSNHKNLLAMYVITTIETLQVMSLLWFPKEETSQWQKFSNFWVFMSYPRLDNFCSLLGVIPTCFYVSVGVSLGFLALILSTLICYFLLKREYEKSYSAIRKISILICTILYIPILTLQMIILKNTLISSSSILIQYDKKKENLTKPFVYLGIISIIFLYLSVYIYNALIFECRHTFSTVSVYSRAHSRLEIGRVHFHFFSILGFALFAENHQEIYRCIVGIVSGYMSYSYFKYCPFYSNHTNTAKVAEFSAIACLAGIFEFSYLTDNSFHSFVLSVLALPVFLGVIVIKTYQVISRSKIDVALANDIFEFEICIREQLISLGDNARIIRYFSEAYDKTRFGKDPAMILWLTNFCYFEMEDENLARIKLGTETIESNRIDIEFQIYRLKQIFLFLGADHHEDISFLKFRMNLDKLKKDDEILCTALMEFLRSIQSGAESTSTMNEVVRKISDLLISTTSQYEDLIRSYPKSSVVLNLYGTFLDNILNQNQKAADILRKMENIKVKNEISSLRTISYFDERNGLLIISGAFDSFAIITYVNETVGKILKQPANTIIGNSISSYVPYPFNINHDNHMKKYILSCETADIPLPLGLFLQNESGFLIECFLQVKCTALEKNPFFVVLMRERMSDREVAIIRPNGLILNHSEKFGYLLGANTKSVKDRFIDEFMEGYTFQTMNENFPYILKKNGKNIGLVRSFKVIKKKKVDIFYIVNDAKEISGWRMGVYSKDVKYSADQKLNIVATVDENEAKLLFMKKHEEKMQSFCPRSYTENKHNDDTRRPSKYLKSQQILSPSIVPQRTLASSVSLNTNNLSSDPKFKNAFSLLVKMKGIVLFFIIVTIALQSSSSLVISSKYSSDALDQISDIGDLTIIISQIPSITRSLNLGQSDPLPESNIILKLQEIESNLTTAIKKFKSISTSTECDSAKIFPEIKEYNPQTLTSKKESMLSIIINLKHSLQVIQSQTEPESGDYLIINSLLLSQELLKSNEQLLKCKKQVIDENGNTGIYVLAASIIFSGVSFLMIVAAWFKLRSLYNDIWNTFYKHSNAQLPELCRRVTERLIDIHRKVEYKTFEYENLKVSQSSFKFFPIFQYFWRLSLYLCVLWSFFFTLFYFSLPNLREIIALHPNALIRSYDADIYTYLLNFWAREKVLNEEFIQSYGNYFLFQEIDENIEDIRKNLKHSQSFFLSDHFFSLIKSEATYSTLHTLSGNSVGQYSLLNDIIMHSYDINQNSTEFILKSFKSKIDDYISTMSTFIPDLSQVLESHYNQENQSILTYTLLYLFAELFLFSFIFLSILSGDISKIQSFKKLGEFIPTKVISPMY